MQVRMLTSWMHFVAKAASKTSELFEIPKKESRSGSFGAAFDEKAVGYRVDQMNSLIKFSRNS